MRDSVAVLHDGAILQVGAPRSVYSTPADPWTAAFLGTANLLPGMSETATAAGRGSGPPSACTCSAIPGRLRARQD